MRVLFSLKDHPTIDLYTLLEQLRKAGIDPAGGAHLGDQQKAILFHKPEDTDQALTFLKRIGIDAERG